MIGIVVASHSHALARAAVDLACEMVPAERRPPVRLAAGLDERTFGTDATAVQAAVEELLADGSSGADDAAGCDGVLVLVDLGSAVLSAQMALDFLDPALLDRVLVSPAPLVEGLVAAMVTASTGAGLAAVAAESVGALTAKKDQLAPAEDLPAGAPGTGPATTDLPQGTRRWSTVLTTPHGLHARPAAALVGALTGFDAHVVLAVEGREASADAHSITQVQGLGARCGERLVATISGTQAAEVQRALEALAARDFDDEPTPAAPATAQPAGDEWPLELAVDVGVYRPGSPDEEEQRLVAAVSRSRDFLDQLVAGNAPDATGDGAQRVTGAVLGAVGAILHDPTLAKGFRRRVQAGDDACTAVRQTMDETAAIFEQMDSPYLRERATDLRALERLVLRSLLDMPLELSDVPAHRVLVVDELDAVTAAQIDPATCPGIRVCAPGDTGHGVVVARARGLRVTVPGPR